MALVRPRASVDHIAGLGGLLCPLLCAQLCALTRGEERTVQGVYVGDDVRQASNVIREGWLRWPSVHESIQTRSLCVVPLPSLLFRFGKQGCAWVSMGSLEGASIGVGCMKRHDDHDGVAWGWK